MGDYEIESLANRVRSCIQKNDYDGIKMDLTNEAMVTVLGALAQVAVSVSSEVFIRVENIVTNIIEQQVMEDCVKMQSEAEQMKHFNKMMEDVAKQIDLTNPVTVELFTKVCEDVRKTMELYFDKSHKPTNLLERCLSIFRRY